jgi:uncharacterized protein (DUF427 family)
MAKAIWQGLTIADSEDTVVVEGNHYFPRAALREDLLRDSGTRTSCPWKGEASYYSLEHEGRRTEDAVWYYPEPKEAASQVTDRVAFWKDVTVEP